MNVMNHLPRLACLIAAAICTLPEPADAQMRARADAALPTAEILQSPEIPSQTKQKRFTPRDWVEIEAAIKVQTAPVPPSGMVDRLVVKWYLAVANPDKPREFLLLTREVTHANVPIEEEIFSSIYLSPSSVRRLTGDYRGGAKAVEMIGYEVIFNGEVVGSAVNRGSRPEWWKIASDKISASDAIPVAIKPETPFAAMWWDRYAEVVAEK